MKPPIPLSPVAKAAPPRSISKWWAIPAGVLVLAIGVIASNKKVLSVLPKLPTSLAPGGEGTGSVPLADVLPGRWDIKTKGYHYVVRFGRHSEMSLVLDVPEEYRARLKLDQIWVGGNYHVIGNDHVEITFTDGRFAAALAQMRGLEIHHLGVKNFDNDSITDGDDDTWKRIGTETAGAATEARDLADPSDPANRPAGAPVAGDPAGAPLTVPGSDAATAANTKRLKAEREKLAALYARLDKRRHKLNAKDVKAVAAFNKDAAEYSRQVERLTAQAGSGNPDVAASKPATVPTASSATGSPAPVATFGASPAPVAAASPAPAVPSPAPLTVSAR